jgi:hypothetical protein
MEMSSLPTVDQFNQKQLEHLLKKAYPELFLIFQALETTRVNPLIIPRFLRKVNRGES